MQKIFRRPLALCASKRENSTNAENILSQLLPLFSLVYIYVMILTVDGVNDQVLILYGLICFISCFALSLLYRGKRVLKVVFAVLNSILLYLLFITSFFIMTFGQISQDTIIKQVLSPDKTYTAILIDSDHGALGGNTIVNIDNNSSEISVLLGRLTKTARIYTGRWGEFETMTLAWQDDNTLLINEKSYSVK